MTTVTAPAINAYYNRDPALIAQEKYSKQTWNERYAHITIAAYAAIAALANIFMYSTVIPVTLVAFNVIVATVAYKLVYPYVTNWFATAKKYQEQGDKETQIAAKLHELRHMDPKALRGLFNDRVIHSTNISWDAIQQAPELTLFARVLWREKQAADFRAPIDPLVAENKFSEAWGQQNAAYKAQTKAAFFALLIINRNLLGKFNDHFAWTELSTEERALRLCRQDDTGRRIVQTRGAHPKFINSETIETATVGALANAMTPI